MLIHQKKIIHAYLSVLIIDMLHIYMYYLMHYIY